MELRSAGWRDGRADEVGRVGADIERTISNTATSNIQHGPISESIPLLMRFGMSTGHRVKLQALRRGWTGYVVQRPVDDLPRLTCDVRIVVLLKSGPQAGKIAVIAEIIDHNRVREPS